MELCGILVEQHKLQGEFVGSRNHNKLALRWFSRCSPTVSNSGATALKMVPNGFRLNNYSSPESLCSKSFQVLTQAKQTEREILVPAPNLSSCHRLHFGIIRSYNPVRYNHLLPNPLELLAERSTAASNAV